MSRFRRWLLICEARRRFEELLSLYNRYPTPALTDDLKRAHERYRYLQRRQQRRSFRQRSTT